jgi:hypothetical protein
MTFIKTVNPIKDHDCEIPFGAKVGTGSIWKCNYCKKLWRKTDYNSWEPLRGDFEGFYDWLFEFFDRVIE